MTKDNYKNYFESRLTIDPKRDKVWTYICDYLKRYIPKNSKVLDLGAGYCSFINNVNAKEKHALDTYKGIKKYASKNVRTHVQSCSKMNNFRNEYFDIVFASNLFEHLTRSDLLNTLKEIRRILKKGGKLILLQPNFKYGYKEYFDDYTHVGIFTEVSMKDLLVANKYHIVKVIPRFLPFTMKTRLKFLSFLTGIYLRSPIRPLAKQMLIVAKK